MRMNKLIFVLVLASSLFIGMFPMQAHAADAGDQGINFDAGRKAELNYQYKMRRAQRRTNALAIRRQRTMSRRGTTPVKRMHFPSVYGTGRFADITRPIRIYRRPTLLESAIRDISIAASKL